MHYRILFFILIFSSTAFSQDLISEDQVRSSFDVPDSVKWVTTYEGFIADFHPVKIILGFDGESYRGKYHLVDGGAVSDLYGEFEGELTVLYETDKWDRATGYIVGQIKETKIIATWSDDEVGSKYAFRALASRIIPLKKFIPAIRQYSSIGQEHRLDLNLICEAPEQLAGTIFFDDGKKFFQVLGECRDVACDEWVIHLFDESGVGATIRTLSSVRNEVRVMLTETDGSEKIVRFAPKSDHSLLVKNMSSDNGLASLVMPDLGSNALKEWAEKHTSEWWQSAELRIKDSAAAPHDEARFAQHWNGWLDIGFLSNSLCSGILSLVGPDESRHFPFILDMNKDRIVPLEDAFKRNVDLKQVMGKYRDEHRVELLTEVDQEYDNWLKSVDFKHHYFRPDGLCLTGDFHPIYGQATMTIPFVELKEIMKKRSIVSSLVK